MSSLWRIRKVHLEPTLWTWWSERSSQLLGPKLAEAPLERCYAGRTAPREMNFNDLRKTVKKNVFPSDIFLTTVSNLKMWLQSFSELLFSLQQSSKNLVSFDFSPLAGKWHIWGQGMKAWSLGRRGAGGYCFPAHKQLQVQKMCARKGRSGRGPLLKGGLLSSVNLFALPFVRPCFPPTPRRTPQFSMWPPEGILVFVVKFSVIT